MIDLHSHILAGVDDGARTIEDSLEMAEAAVADGIRVIAATPHVNDVFPTSAADVERGVFELRAALAAAGIPLDVRPGGEVALDRLDSMSVEERRRLGLGGNPARLLLEFPYFGWPLAVDRWVTMLSAEGITPVIAHPERNGEVAADPERVRPLARAGALLQITAAALDGRMGRRACEAGFELIDRGLAHLIASDAHMPEIREIGMHAAAEAVGDEALARWLTHDAPAAILAGDLLPERPARARRFRLFRS